jgi:S1-C subfamily serine protease
MSKVDDDLTGPPGRSGGERPAGRGREPWAGYDAGLPAPPSTPVRRTYPPATPPRRNGWAAGLIALFAAMLLVGTLIGVNVGSNTPPSTGRLGGSGGGTGPASTGASGSVVDINTATELLGADGLRPLGAGTGMILTPDGEVLTNNHVVQGASSIRVSIPGHGSPTATVLGVDPTDDVALLQLDNVSGLPTVTTGDSSTVRVGDHVTVVGNAFGQGGPPTVATGSVTAVHRSITAHDPAGGTSEQLNDVIQVSASVHPGDSGGALLNADGQVVGIITAGPGDNANANVGFAIPVNDALDIVQQIRAGHDTADVLIGDRGFIGVAVQPMDPTAAAQLGLSDVAGVLVTGVEPESPAAQAGIAAPAVIRAVDGNPVNSLEELGAAIHAKTPGQQLEITWIDQQGEHTSTTTLTTGPAV